VIQSVRNLSIRKIQSFHDFILSGYLLYFLHVDVVPTELILVGILVYVIWKDADIKRRHAPLKPALLTQISNLLKPPRTYKFYQAEQGRDTSSAYSLIYKSYIFLDTSITRKDELGRDALCTIEHEIAHSKRNDSFVTFLYEEASKYLIFVMALAPVSYLVAGKSMLPAGASFLIFILYTLLENGPAIYLFLSRKRYLHRREYMADAIANEADPERYSSFLKDKATEEGRLKRFSAEIEEQSAGFDPHPSFQSRKDFILGRVETPVSSIVLFCLVSGLFSIYAMLGFGTSLIDTANAPYTSSFIKSLIGLLLLYVYLNNIFSIVSIVANFRENGLSIKDKLAGTGALLIGLLVAPLVLAFSPVVGGVEANVKVMSIIAGLYWLVAIYPVLFLFVSSIFFGELRFKFIVGLVALGVGYTIFDVLREHLSAYGTSYLQPLNVIAVIFLPLALAPIVEGGCRLFASAFIWSWRLVRYGSVRG